MNAAGSEEDKEDRRLRELGIDPDGDPADIFEALSQIRDEARALKQKRHDERIQKAGIHPDVYADDRK